MKPTKKSKPPVNPLPKFAEIRMIEGRQVLAYTQSDHDSIAVHVHFRTQNGTNVGMKIGFDSDPDAEKRMNDCFAKFCAGHLDTMLREHITGADTIDVEPA
jgi:hypothetical protein